MNNDINVEYLFEDEIEMNAINETLKRFKFYLNNWDKMADAETMKNTFKLKDEDHLTLFEEENGNEQGIAQYPDNE